jgi:hypothetical protein
MIDTIVITLPSTQYQITKPALFTPPAHWVLAETRTAHIVSKQNPLKRELIQGIYKPRLTLASRITASGKRDITLKIELSLPKLLFGNNFDELRLKDFAAVVDKLVTVLATMGVETTADALSTALVSAIHYSKNFRLTDGSTPYHYIQKIKAANIKLSLDVNQTDYRNEGHSYRWHCNSYEVVFYDKIKDLEKAQISSKRALEKDNEVQLHIFKKLRTRRKKLEILRMEVRLNKRIKIKQLFKMLRIKAELTFKKLFKPAISKKVLIHYLDELESKRPLLLDYKVSSSKALLADLIMNNPDMSPKQIMQLFGLKQALADVTLRELRVMFAKHNPRSWYRLIAEAQKVQLPHTPSPLRNLREQLR